MAADMPIRIKAHLTLLLQGSPQTLAGAQEAGFDRAETQPLGGGKVLLFLTLQVAATQNLLIVGFKHRQHPFDVCGQTVDRGQFLAVALEQFFRQLFRQLFRQWLGRTVQPVMIDQGVTCDLEQPSSGLFQYAKAFALAHGLDEHFLQQVVGLMPVVALMAQETPQLSLMVAPSVQHAGKGNAIALGRRCHRQGVDCGVSCAAVCSRHWSMAERSICSPGLATKVTSTPSTPG